MTHKIISSQRSNCMNLAYNPIYQESSSVADYLEFSPKKTKPGTLRQEKKKKIMPRKAWKMKELLKHCQLFIING